MLGYLAPIPNSAQHKGKYCTFSFDAKIYCVVGGVVSTKNFGYTISTSDTKDINKRQFIVGFQDGFDGVSPTIKKSKYGDSDWGVGNSQGFDLSTSTAGGSVGYVKATMKYLMQMISIST